MKGQRFIPLLVIAAGLLAYQNSFTGPFIFDGVPLIRENRTIRHLWPPWEIIMHTSRPVVMLSVAVNYALGGLNPWGYHLFNVCIHILAALTLYGVMRRTFASEPPRAKWDASAPWLAAAVAVIWLVHPLQTESVTYTIQRGESLMGLFYLLTLYCVIRSNGSARGWWWAAGAVASCALGMGSKQVMVTAPAVVALYDRVFLAKSWREVMQRRWGAYAGMAATWLWLPVLMARGPLEVPNWHPTAGFAYKGITPLQYALTQPGVILHYLRLVFWPHPLCLDYGWNCGWPLAQTLGDAWPELTLVGVLLAATVWAWWRRPALGFLGVWFFAILSPTSSFVPVADLVVEHRMYLPLAAVVTLGVVGIHTLVGRRTLAVVVVLVVGLGFLTWRRNQDYRSECAIWQDTVVRCPNNPRAHNNLGNLLRARGNVSEAITHYEQALRIKPDYVEAHTSLGAALRQTGRVQEAMEHYEQALRINPDYAEAHNNLGNALWQMGRLRDAIEQYKQALRTRPDYAEAHNNLGNALWQMGRLRDAIEQYEQALQNKPDDAEGHDHLGVIWWREGKVPEAISHFEQALHFRPDYAEAHNDLGVALVERDKIEEAIGHYGQALRLKPDYAEAHANLGNALLRLGKASEAREHYEQALKLKPDYAEAHNSLGIVLWQEGRSEEAIEHFERALRIKPDYAEAHYNLGVTLEQGGKVSEAKEHYAQALKLKPDYTKAQNGLARLRAVQ